MGSPRAWERQTSAVSAGLGSWASQLEAFPGKLSLRPAGAAPSEAREEGGEGGRKSSWLGHCTGRNQLWRLGGAWRRAATRPGGKKPPRSEMPRQEMRCNL